ncbi:MAG: hypothetical protein QM682_04995 [Paracoccus sp. (in: a-proteobacteria)]|uniref:hypothetical protein n=1 Tax=Paracoccus sp. TaxID=267 RepID=UPI0039E65BD4
MYVAPRPEYDDDPWFAVRLALLPVIGFVMGMLLQSPMPMIYPVLLFSLPASARKAFNPGRNFGAPVMFSGMLWIMSWVVVFFGPIPLTLILIIGLIYFAGFYLIQVTGSAVGMLIIVAAALMSIMGLGSYDSMAWLRSEMTKAAFISAIVAPVLHMLMPVRTTEIHEDVYDPAEPDGRAIRAGIRAVVLLAYTLFLYTFIDFGNIMLAVAGMFVLVFTTRESIWRETAQRSFSVILGGVMALIVLGALSLVGHLFVLLGLVFLMTLWACHKMQTGKLPSMAYQDAASIMISMVGSALATSDPTWAFMQRAALTMVATVISAMVVIWLDQLLTGRTARHVSEVAGSV